MILSKSTTINPNFGLGWIGFGHSFSLENEYEQAILAYSTANKLMKGLKYFYISAHQPKMYIGIQHIRLNNTVLALGYLESSRDISKFDPVLENELGMVWYIKEEFIFLKLRFTKAAFYFSSAISLIDVSLKKSKLLEQIWCNYGHVNRKLKYIIL